MATAKPNIGAGDYASASIITNLISAIKTEFTTRRDNPYNKTSLKNAGLSLTSPSANGYVDWEIYNNVMSLLKKYYKNGATIDPNNSFIIVDTLRNGYDIINDFENDGMTDANTACGGAC